MKGKHWSIPFGMVFKKYKCSTCGNKLEKYKTHRIVSKDDHDYFQYQDYNMFPRTDHDVYSYEFTCKHCKKNISFHDQCIIERIQKKLNKIILSDDEIKKYYLNEQYNDKKRSLRLEIIIFSIFMFTALFLAIILLKQKTLYNILIISLFMLLFYIINIYHIICSFEGKRKRRIHKDYSFSKSSQFERLHAFSTNNKYLIAKSDYCYCYHCKGKFESSEIVKYIDNNNTAICPHCNVDAVLPDCIDINIDNNILDEMNKYWF